ncbi:MAG: transcription-repair coupling factor [Phycisphaerales bacterium]|nr:MAG: transcription-repair coupling factor [Phycisphaerales bacterium]
MSTDWLRRIANDGVVGRLAGLIARGGAVSARGSVGSSTVLLTAALQRQLGRPLILVVAHLDEADEAIDELEALGVEAAKFPALEVLPGETSISPELLAERLSVVRLLMEERPPQVFVCPVQAMMQRVPQAQRLGRIMRVIRKGDSLDGGELAQWLTEAGCQRVETIDSAGEFAIRGGIIDIFPPGGEPVRIDLFGDEVEGLFQIDLDTMGSDRRLDSVELVGEAGEDVLSGEGTVNLADMLPAESVAVLAELIELAEQGRSYMERAVEAGGLDECSAVMKRLGERCAAVVDINQFMSGQAAGGAGSGAGEALELPVGGLPGFAESAAAALNELAELAAGHDAVVFCQNQGEAQRMGELLAEHTPDAPVEVITHYLHRGFVWGEGDAAARPLALVPYHELLNRYQTRRRIRRIATARALDTFVDLEAGDYVVHRDHGIAKFLGLRTMSGGGGAASQEFLTLEFARGAKLHVPAPKIELVQKYIGAFRGRPELSTFGGKRWKKQKEKVSEAVVDLASEMLRIQAAREALPGIRYPADTAWQREFEAEFPYEETEDQLASIVAVKRDMSDPKPMDRLICGDVGFGKTEVAIRAAFKAVEYGRQVAVLVPTTVLAEQHERTFRERFADYPFLIESISRFKTKKEQNELVERLLKGQLDIIIGTHRLLSGDVKFADLGLVVIDEEQRFGVEHKQRLLEFRATADVMTLSATPIPRTLHMALLGLRDISSLTTAPLDRRAIVTEVLGYDSRRIKRAIERELAREGQIFFLHNRVYNIQSVADDIQRLAPNARVIVGHGQMPSRQLEAVMLKFLRRDADILVCTTIIESGIDIPTANTIFVNDAQRFGLSELHQLRGRVGRYKHRAYCYLLLPTDRVISEVALKRMRALESFSMLGAGFKIALRDLEIRGAGNLLGAEQSGHIAAVGYEMYCQLLEQAVRALKKQKTIRAVDTTIDIGVEGSLPKGYIPSDARRMDAYRRISASNDFEELGRIERNLVSAYGDLPRSGRVLLELAEIRLAAAELGIATVSRHENDIIFKTTRPRDLEEQMAGAKGSLRVVGQPDAAGLSSVYFRPPKQYLEDDSLLAVLRRRLRRKARDVVTAQ